MSGENVALVREVFDAIRTGNRPGYRAHLDPELRIEPSRNSLSRKALAGSEGFELDVRGGRVVRIRVFDDEREALDAFNRVSD